MAETIQTLEELSTLKPPAAPQPPKYVQKLDKQGRAYATGKRKDAVARVWIKLGAGNIVINERPVETYFARPVLRMLIQQPLVAASRQGQYDVTCTVAGGGLSGQAGAVRHGLSKALMRHEPDLRTVLKHGGFLYSSDSYNDDLPYWVQVDGTPHLIVPYTLEVNDMKFGVAPGYTAGDGWLQAMKDSFDVLYAEGARSPKMMSIGLHCRLVGRPSRTATLARFLDYVASKPKVWVATREEIARHWMKVHPAA